MTASTHSQYNYNRRNSTTPYTIPVKHQQHINQHSQTIGSPIQSNGFQSSHTGGPISSSVPTFSREFVVRRISEGETGRLKEELKCEACGKGYKHISSLAKHLWEHTPEWNVTKKLLISKHQQVQLLEAASILVGMNENSSSRRSSVFQEEEDPKYSSPFSPSNSADTNLTSNTPTPPMNADSSEKPRIGQPTFKNSFNVNSTESHKSSNIPTPVNLNRSHSISQYPPSTANANINHITSPITGGYLDNLNDKDRGRSNSITIPNNTNNDELKSPPSSFKNSQLPPPQPTTFVPSSKLNYSPRIVFPNNNASSSDDLDKESHNNDSFEDESIIGKME